MSEDTVASYPTEGNPEVGTENHSTVTSSDGLNTLPPMEEGNPPDNGETQPPLEGQQTPSAQEITKLMEGFKKQLSDKDRYIGEQRKSMDEMKETVAELRGRLDGYTSANKEDPEESRELRENEILQDIPGAFDKLEQKITKYINDTVGKKEQEFMQQIQAREDYKKMWDSFYENNENLKAFREDLIPAIVTEIRPKIAHLSQSEALERVKEEANRRILKLKQRLGGGNQMPTAPLPRTSHRGSPQALPEDPVSLKDLGDSITNSHMEIVDRVKGRSSVKTR